jgi:hypothetical protein
MIHEPEHPASPGCIQAEKYAAAVFRIQESRSGIAADPAGKMAGIIGVEHGQFPPGGHKTGEGIIIIPDGHHAAKVIVDPDHSYCCAIHIEGLELSVSDPALDQVLFTGIVEAQGSGLTALGI